MMVVKIVIYTFILLSSFLIGILQSQKYVSRVNELKEFKNALNIFKTKIRFTGETIPEIFLEISNNIGSNIGEIFKIASNNMQLVGAGRAWDLALDLDILNLNKEDINALKNMSKLLGQTNVEGQISQIDLTNSFLDMQIAKAEKEREKSEKLYRMLGMVIGIAIVIILI